jgi:Xaa-Pro aminopeptidase
MPPKRSVLTLPVARRCSPPWAAASPSWPPRPSACAIATRSYPFRFDSYFYYLTGFRSPEAVVVLIAGDQPRSLLFCREKDLERRSGTVTATVPRPRATAFGFDEAYPIGQLDDKLLPKLLADQPALYADIGGTTPPGTPASIDWLNRRPRRRSARAATAPGEIRDVRAASSTTCAS